MRNRGRIVACSYKIRSGSVVGHRIPAGDENIQIIRFQRGYADPVHPSPVGVQIGNCPVEFIRLCNFSSAVGSREPTVEEPAAGAVRRIGFGEDVTVHRSLCDTGDVLRRRVVGELAAVGVEDDGVLPVCRGVRGSVNGVAGDHGDGGRPAGEGVGVVGVLRTGGSGSLIGGGGAGGVGLGGQLCAVPVLPGDRELVLGNLLPVAVDGGKGGLRTYGGKGYIGTGVVLAVIVIGIRAIRPADDGVVVAAADVAGGLGVLGHGALGDGGHVAQGLVSVGIHILPGDLDSLGSDGVVVVHGEGLAGVNLDGGLLQLGRPVIVQHGVPVSVFHRLHDHPVEELVVHVVLRGRCRLGKGLGLVGVDVGIVVVDHTGIGLRRKVAFAVNCVVADADAVGADGVLPPQSVNDELADDVFILGLIVFVQLVVVVGLVPIHRVDAGTAAGSVGVGKIHIRGLIRNGLAEVEGYVAVGIQIPAQQGVALAGGRGNGAVLDLLAVVQTEGGGLVAGEGDLRVGVAAGVVQNHAEPLDRPLGINGHVIVGHGAGPVKLLRAAGVLIPAVEVIADGAVGGRDVGKARKTRAVLHVLDFLDLRASGEIGKLKLPAGKVDEDVALGLAVIGVGAIGIGDKAGGDAVGGEIVAVGVESQELIVVIVLVRSAIQRRRCLLLKDQILVHLLLHPVDGLRVAHRILFSVDDPLKGMLRLGDGVLVVRRQAPVLAVFVVNVVPVVAGTGFRPGGHGRAVETLAGVVFNGGDGREGLLIPGIVVPSIARGQLNRELIPRSCPFAPRNPQLGVVVGPAGARDVGQLIPLALDDRVLITGRAGGILGCHINVGGNRAAARLVIPDRAVLSVVGNEVHRAGAVAAGAGRRGQRRVAGDGSVGHVVEADLNHSAVIVHVHDRGAVTLDLHTVGVGVRCVIDEVISQLAADGVAPLGVRGDKVRDLAGGALAGLDGLVEVVGLIAVRSVPGVVNALGPEHDRILGVGLGNPLSVDGGVGSKRLIPFELILRPLIHDHAGLQGLGHAVVVHLSGLGGELALQADVERLVVGILRLLFSGLGIPAAEGVTGAVGLGVVIHAVVVGVAVVVGFGNRLSLAVVFRGGEGGGGAVQILVDIVVEHQPVAFLQVGVQVDIAVQRNGLAVLIIEHVRRVGGRIAGVVDGLGPAEVRPAALERGIGHVDLIFARASGLQTNDGAVLVVVGDEHDVPDNGVVAEAVLILVQSGIVFHHVGVDLVDTGSGGIFRDRAGSRPALECLVFADRGNAGVEDRGVAQRLPLADLILPDGLLVDDRPAALSVGLVEGDGEQLHRGAGADDVDGEVLGLEAQGLGAAAGGADQLGGDILQNAVVPHMEHGGILKLFHAGQRELDLDRLLGLELGAVLGEGDVSGSDDLDAGLLGKRSKVSLVGDAADGHIGVLRQSADRGADGDAHVLAGFAVEALGGPGLGGKLLLDHLVHPHEDLRQLGAGGGGLGTEAAVLKAGDQTRAGAVDHGVAGILGHALHVGEGAVDGVLQLDASVLDVGVEHHAEILPGDGAVGREVPVANAGHDAVHGGPGRGAGVPLAFLGVLEDSGAVVGLHFSETGQDRDHHAAGDRRVGREGRFADAGHPAFLIDILHGGGIPGAVRHIPEGRGLDRDQEHGDSHDDGKRQS